MKKTFVFASLLVASTLIFAIFLLRASAFGIKQMKNGSSPSAPAMTFTVTSTDDDGAGTLRDAIMQANVTPGADVINFAIGINTPTIYVGSGVALPLPAITEAVTIDGATGGATRVELDGTQAGAPADGLIITAGNCIIRGLVINRFSGNGIFISGGSGTVVQGNFIGTDANGTAALGNAQNGVVIDFGSSNNTIGGTTAGAGNLISGNVSGGLGISGSTGNLVQGNLIGTDVSGVAPLGNGSGVRVIGSSTDNTIGGTLAGAPNRIAFNTSAGILMAGGIQNAILSNSIFSNADLGINLSDDLITPNDPCDADVGANNLQNFPDLTSASQSGGNTVIQGSLISTASMQFRIEFFANSICDGSGNGEGETFIGSTVVVTDAACVAPINISLPVSVPVGQFITATATDFQNNTSEFSACVQVSEAACTISCPADVTANTLPLPFGCGRLVSYAAPTTVGPCGSVACVPPSNSFFAVGVTPVTCTAEDGPSCSFNVTVKDTTAPRITCSGNISTSAPPGQNSVVVSYSAPLVVDNCSSPAPTCTPPSGSAFPLGTSMVTCTATDAADNTSTCSFSVTVRDTQAPTITCPSTVAVNIPAGQCQAVVSFPPPTVTDNVPGTTVTCTPPSGSTFPLGVTTVNCTALDTTGNRATCAFTVTVQRSPSPGDEQTITLGFGGRTPVPPVRKARKNPPASCECSVFFSIPNTGCGVLGLDLLSISRTGSDVTSGRITNPDDSKFFSLRIVNPDGSERPFPELCSGACIQIAPGQSQTFRVVFSPIVPAPSGKTTGLAAPQVLPNTVTSKITFSSSQGGTITVDLIAHVGTALQLINASNPKKGASASFTRSGNRFILTYAVFDSNLDTNRAKYELLDQTGALVGQAIEVDLAGPIVDGRVFKGQSFVVEQMFSGANSHSEITSLRLTVFDAESSDSLTTQLGSSVNVAGIVADISAGPVTLKPRTLKLSRSRP